MAANPKLYNLVRVNTSTVGTGTLALGSAVSGFLTFAQANAVDGDVVVYSIRDGSGSECGQGTYSSSGQTLTRDTVYRSTGAGNTGKISLSGSAQVTVTATAEALAALAHLVDSGSALVVNYNPATAPAPPSGVALQLVGPNDVIGGLCLDSYGAAHIAGFVGRAARGTAALPSAIQSGDNIFAIVAQGYGLTAFPSVLRSFLLVQAAELFTDSAQGISVHLRSVTPGQLNPTSRLVIYADGGITIQDSSGNNPTGNSKGAGTLNVVGQIFVQGVPCAAPPLTVAALPAAAGNTGARLFVTDATATTFASIVAGSGANGVPVYSDGTNWRIG